MMISDQIKKNLLDLQYNKYVQYQTTSIIILFTYYIGLTIVFLTEEIQIEDISQIIFVGVVSIVITFFILLLIMHYKKHQKNIFSEIKNLRLD